MKIYIAGKVSKDSHFGKHHWRDEFRAELASLSGLELTQLDPLASQELGQSPQEIFAKDCRLINEADVLVVYLSDDISVGGSQEILVARYLKKPVIGLAPKGGKFNGARREMLGTVVEDYKDPFVFSTCDVVCDSLEAVARALKDIDKLETKGLSIIDEALGS